MMHLIARKESGEAICPETVINNVRVPLRCYPIRAHVVMLDNQPRAVLQHDYLALISMPDGEYRAMMPSEQNAYREQKDRENTVEE